MHHRRRESNQPSGTNDLRLPGPTGVREGSDISAILQQIEERGIRFINLEFSDVVGIVKSVTIPALEFADVPVDGKWFDGSAIEGFARVAETDMYLRPILATYAEIPWVSGSGSV